MERLCQNWMIGGREQVKKRLYLTTLTLWKQNFNAK